VRKTTPRERRRYEEKKTNNRTGHGELHPEYDLSNLGKPVRGKYAKVYEGRTNLLLLSPDVAAGRRARSGA